ncbi:TdeIII family type II restriction endonuclease [Ruminococcus sp.]
MNEEMKKSVQSIVDTAIACFAEGLKSRYEKEAEDPKGVINSKKNNCFIAELGEEFIFYSAFVRSFDSSFGNVLERMGNNIAKLFYTVNNEISSFLLPEQTQHISNIMSSYDDHTPPEIWHYTNQRFITPRNTVSFKQVHQTDNYFYDENAKTHYIIELKAGGDLDNKKSRAEKIELLKEYFLLKNKISDEEQVKIYFATAYNKFGEGNDWRQERVRQYFANEELLIGKDYWNFVCNDKNGFNIIFDQYKRSVSHIKRSLEEIKSIYFSGENYD